VSWRSCSGRNKRPSIAGRLREIFSEPPGD
jgi:hypothetical protein